MSKQDTHFFNVFSVVLGLLIVVAIAIFAFSSVLEDESVDARRQTDPLLRREVLERIRPFGQVAVAGQDNAALALAPPPTAAAAPAVAALPANGEETYKAVCHVCHDAGIAGAPKTGDKAAWAARIAQGGATLHKHAIEGYQGQAGYMPPKGGRADLTDALVSEAVDYMVAQSR